MLAVKFLFVVVKGKRKREIFSKGVSDSQKDGEGRRWGNRQYSLILIYFIFTSCLMIKCIYIIIIHLGGGGVPMHLR